MTRRPADVQPLLLDELRARGIPVLKALEDGSVVIAFGGKEITVGLENLARNYTRDHDPDLVPAFVDGLLATLEPLPSWPDAASGIRYSAEPSDHDFRDTLHEQITPAISRVLTYTDAHEARISWLAPSHLKEWGVSIDELSRVGAANMNRLLAQTVLEVEEVDGSPLGLFSTPSVFKGSLIFCQDLKGFVSKRLGWPLHAVVPCRDFVYVFVDTDLIPRLGGVVMREYESSGYPVSPEVLRIDDSGIQAVGRFGA